LAVGARHDGGVGGAAAFRALGVVAPRAIHEREQKARIRVGEAGARRMTDRAAVIDWLLDREHSDPSIRWQVMRDLLDAPHSEWAAERAKVETEGWGARLLAVEDEDGQWAGGAHFPADFDWRGPEAQRGPDGRMASQPWTATSHSLSLLREFGLDPSSARARRAVKLIGANASWEEGGQ